MAAAVEVDREELDRDRNPRHGADDAAVDEGAPVNRFAPLVGVLHHEPEEDHRGVDAEDCDQCRSLADASQHCDQDDHQRSADRVLPPARRIDSTRHIRVVPAVRQRARDDQVVGRGEQQKERDGDVDPQAEELRRRAELAFAGWPQHVGHVDRQRRRLGDYQQNNRLGGCDKADDHVEAAELACGALVERGCG